VRGRKKEKERNTIGKEERKEKESRKTRQNNFEACRVHGN
jgi:hypothetical protein